MPANLIDDFTTASDHETQILYLFKQKYVAMMTEARVCLLKRVFSIFFYN